MSAGYRDWNDVVLPVLREIHAAEMESRDTRASELLVELTEGNPRRTRAVGMRIRDEELASTVYFDGGISDAPNFLGGLTGRGMRAIGEWPPDDFAAALSTALEQAVEQASSPEERSRLQRVLGAAGRVTEASSAGLITAVIRAAGGI